ncbi:hypothetical protein BVC80_9083g116 [Macleaya cordata]|uniref:Uncharacterized protein n=1 Tax=Macleaya cordata TaxID=56857 RepID=A0A200PRL0_MACCD|nr:hypothetical protein BVC80_9083g116 [Macleaya cordata]
MASITIEELRSFHSIDRELYSRLVLNLHRDPFQSMQIIALWICLEQVGYPNIILKMLFLTDDAVNSIADEGVHILNCITSEIPPPISTNINVTPLTLDLMNNQEISLQFLYENRLTALSGIMKIVNEVCFKAFEDILWLALGNAAAVPYPTTVIVPEFGESSSFTRSGLNPPTPKNDIDVPQGERTLFITFSRGYPITEREIRNFFVRSYGDCVEAIYMQDITPNEQPMYAHLVLRSASTIAVILHGKERAQFLINGKNLRVRHHGSE